jgi:hypothetical protein
MPQPINISGSRAAGVLGLSKYQTQVDVWLKIKGREFCEKNNYIYPEFEGNSATIMGNHFENAIIKMTEKNYNYKITQKQKLFKKEYLSCHIDGAFCDLLQLIEVKTTNIKSFRDGWGEPGTDKIPEDYQVQVQHNMMLGDFTSCIVPVLIFPKMQDEILQQIEIKKINATKWTSVLNEMGYLKYYHVTANPDLQSLMLEKYAEFWERYIIGSEIPEPVSYSDIKALCPEPVGTIIADDRIMRLAAEYKQIGDEISNTGSLGRRREELKVAILDYMRTAGAVEDDESRDKFILRDQQGRKLASWGRNKSGSMVFR